MAHTKKKTPLKNEIAVKNRHFIAILLVVLAVMVFISGMGFYKAEDLRKMYDGISRNVKNNDLISCIDSLCVVNKVYSSDVSWEDCNSLKGSLRDSCINTIARKEALETKSKDACEKMTNPQDRDSCYFSLKLTTDNPTYCQYIKDELLKDMCLG